VANNDAFLVGGDLGEAREGLAALSRRKTAVERDEVS
jgi:hypothetical protein